MGAKKAAGEIERFPGGRKAVRGGSAADLGAEQMETTQALEPPPLLP